jgi:hypothetical protein
VRLIAAIQLSNIKKKSGYDWFLHETGVTAPKTENSLFWNFREREHRSR